MFPENPPSPFYSLSPVAEVTEQRNMVLQRTIKSSASGPHGMER